MVGLIPYRITSGIYAFFGSDGDVSIPRGKLAERNEAKSTRKPRKCGNTVLGEDFFINI